MSSGWFSLKIGALLVLALAACDSAGGAQDAFFDDASGAVTGFTETTARGEVVSADDDDWRTAPLFRGQVRVAPVFPNPAGQTEPVNLTVSILFSEAVQGGLEVRARGTNGRFVPLDRLSRTQPGDYVLSFSAAALGRSGLVRLFVFDFAGDIVSYGDLMIR